MEVPLIVKNVLQSDMDEDGFMSSLPTEASFMYDTTNNINNNDASQINGGDWCRRNIYVQAKETSAEFVINGQLENYCQKTMGNLLDNCDLYFAKKDILMNECFQQIKTKHSEESNWKEETKLKALEQLKRFPDINEDEKTELVEQM